MAQDTIPPMTAEEEDAVIQSRLVNDERPLKRLVRKFQSFSTQARSPSPDDSAVDSARASFLQELASFQMLIKKATLTINAEARQVQEYQAERARIESEHALQREQIAALKVALEEAQLVRRRKMEYDQVAEKVNTLPTRTELEESIASLESDISGIQEEQDQLRRNVQTRRERLEQIQKDIQEMNRLGRENVPEDDPTATGGEEESETTESPTQSQDNGATGSSSTNGSTSTPHASDARLNPDARPFKPSGSAPLRETVLRRQHQGAATSAPSPSAALAEEGEDVEMGEVSELLGVKEEGKRPKISRDDLEEGEASDEDSRLELLDDR